MTPITKRTRAEVWLEAAKALLEADARTYNLILEAEEPEIATPASRAIELLVDNFLREHNCQPLHTVAETIFLLPNIASGDLRRFSPTRIQYTRQLNPKTRGAPMHYG